MKIKAKIKVGNETYIEDEFLYTEDLGTMIFPKFLKVFEEVNERECYSEEDKSLKFSLIEGESQEFKEVIKNYGCENYV